MNAKQQYQLAYRLARINHQMAPWTLGEELYWMNRALENIYYQWTAANPDDTEYNDLHHLENVALSPFAPRDDAAEIWNHLRQTIHNMLNGNEVCCSILTK